MVNLYFLLFLVIIAIANVPSHPNALYPKDVNFAQLQLKCPVELRKIQFCATQYEECFGHSRTAGYCGNQFCDCSKVDDESSSQECRHYLDQACFAVQNYGYEFQREILEKREKLAAESVQKRLKPEEL
ncbi:unnamed protein product [Caenorhabditis brenneri]